MGKISLANKPASHILTYNTGKFDDLLWSEEHHLSDHLLRLKTLLIVNILTFQRELGCRFTLTVSALARGIIFVSMHICCI